MSKNKNKNITTKTDAYSATLSTKLTNPVSSSIPNGISTNNQQGIEIYLLGNTVFCINAALVNLKSVQVVLLIAYLTESKTSISRNDLAQLFWPSRELKDALKLLSTLLSRANTLLPNYLISYTTAKGIRHIALAEIQDLGTNSSYIDSLEFKRLLMNSDSASLEHANKIYKGHFLAGIEIKGDSQGLELWLERTRETYQHYYSDLQHKLLDLAYAEKNYEKALSYLQELLILNPFDETLHRLAFKLYYKLNNKLGLVNHYSYLITCIAEEFGTEVDEELSDYYNHLLKKLELANSKAIHYSSAELHYSETFIGRHKELALLKNLVLQERFISIVGMTGIGKSSLLSQLIDQFKLERAFPDGILVIPQELSIGFDLLDYLIIQFGLTSNESSRQNLLDFLKAKEILLAFDSTTILRDEYHLLSDLIRETSSLKIIVTSVAPLGVAYEVVTYLEGLDIPSKTMSPDEAFATEAGQFFLHCIKKIVPDSKVEGQYWQSFYDLCYLSQGSPLIIAMAASWIDILSLEEINSDLLGLTHQHSDAIPRHKSVKAIFETVWQSQKYMPYPNNHHYLSQGKNNAPIILTEADMKSFDDYTSAHPLYKQFRSEKNN